MKELDRDRLTDLFLRTYAQTAAAPCTYHDRTYRIREVTVTIAEFQSGNGWTPMPPGLTNQLLKLIARGEAKKL